MSEYWVVDPELNAIRVDRRSAERYDRPVEISLEAGDVLSSPLLPSLQIALADVFKEEVSHAGALSQALGQ